MKTIAAAIFAASCIASCSGIPEGAGIIYTPDSICLVGMTGEAAEACYNTKEKVGYIKYANGRTERLQAVGGGYAGGKIVIQLVDGGRVSIGRDGVVITEPALPSK